MFSDCTLDPAANIADCSGGVISQELTSTVTATLSDYSDLIMPVTITAGVEKLSAATGPSDSEAVTTGPSNTGVTTPAPTPTTSGAPADNSGDNSNGSDESTDQTTSTSTGGVARITQNAAVLGAAALVGGAMMM